LISSHSPAISTGMEERTAEWLRQSDYDMDTAHYMYRGGRYFYAVFMCHLAIEKSLKGLYYERLRQFPPKSHSLVYLLNEIGIKPPEEPGKFIIKLSEASIPTRYPEDLAKLQLDYTENIVREILVKGKEVVTWIRRQL
jgi:HEPN domain-containing protein